MTRSYRALALAAALFAAQAAIAASFTLATDDPVTITYDETKLKPTWAEPFQCTLGGPGTGCFGAFFDPVNASLSGSLVLSASLSASSNFDFVINSYMYPVVAPDPADLTLRLSDWQFTKYVSALDLNTNTVLLAEASYQNLALNLTPFQSKNLRLTFRFEFSPGQYVTPAGAFQDSATLSYFGFVTSPVPESSTSALLVAGLGLVGVAVRRAKPQRPL